MIETSQPPQETLLEQHFPRTSKHLRLARTFWERNTSEKLRSKVENSKQLVPEKVRAACEVYLPQLRELFGTPETGLKQDYLYHGTGMYKYAGEKYRQDFSQYSQASLTPVLPSILEKGILPHHDTWLPRSEMESASFAVNHFYAKWYADKYQPATYTLEWSYGSPHDWFYFFMADSIREELMSFLKPGKLRDFATMYFRLTRPKKSVLPEGELNKLQRWVSSLRKDVTPGMGDIETMEAVTDIPENWGAVVMIDKKQVPTMPMSLGSAHEVRTESPVAPTAFVALEVPFSKVDEAKNLLASKNLQIPVLPLEVVDYFLSQFPIRQVTKRVER